MKNLLYLTLVLAAFIMAVPSVSWGACAKEFHCSDGQISNNSKCCCNDGEEISGGEGQFFSCSKIKAPATDPKGPVAAGTRVKAGTGSSTSGPGKDCLNDPDCPVGQTCKNNQCSGGDIKANTSGQRSISGSSAKTTGLLIPKVNRIYANMANMNGEITIAFQERNKSGYKTCKIAKNEPIVITCHPGGHEEGKENQAALYKIREDGFSARVIPVDGRCDFKVHKAKDFGGMAKYDCIDEPDCNKTDMTPYVVEDCNPEKEDGTKPAIILGSNGLQIVVGKNAQFTLKYNDIVTPGVQLGKNSLLVSTSNHPSPTATGTAFSVYPMPPKLPGKGPQGPPTFK